jgi:hypothetical protein
MFTQSHAAGRIQNNACANSSDPFVHMGIGNWYSYSQVCVPTCPVCCDLCERARQRDIMRIWVWSRNLNSPAIPCARHMFWGLGQYRLRWRDCQSKRLSSPRASVRFSLQTTVVGFSQVLWFSPTGQGCWHLTGWVGTLELTPNWPFYCSGAWDASRRGALWKALALARSD